MTREEAVAEWERMKQRVVDLEARDKDKDARVRKLERQLQGILMVEAVKGKRVWWPKDQRLEHNIRMHQADTSQIVCSCTER